MQIANQSLLKNNNNNLSKISQLINSHKETPQSTNTNNLIAKLKKNLNNARKEKNLLLQMQQQQPQQQNPGAGASCSLKNAAI